MLRAHSLLPLMAAVTLLERKKGLHISFLNVGKRVASSYNNFIIFGANCEESCPVVKKYVQLLSQEIADLD